MPIRNIKTLIILAGLVFLGLVGCYTKNNFLQSTTSVKIIVKGKGLDQIATNENIKLHISGVNLGVNEDINRDNYFSIDRTFENINELVKGLELEQKNLSQGKWRIAVNLFGWKTACSTIIQDNQIPQLIFSYQEHLCP